jgi:hypothetical protein
MGRHAVLPHLLLSDACVLALPGSGFAHAGRCVNRIVAENVYEAEAQSLAVEGGIPVLIESLGYGYGEK